MNMEFADGPKPLSSLAELAVAEIYAANQAGRKIDDDLVDEVAGIIHDSWLQNNGASGIPASKNKPYGDLDEEDKQQYHIVVKKAVEALKPVNPEQ